MTRLADVARPAGPAFFAPLIRPRILQRVEAAAAGRIILIAAPAGYGKSLALSHWLAERTETYVRFNLQAEHDTLLGFARGLSEAFTDSIPALEKTVSTASQNSASSNAPGNEMARWMAAHLEQFRGIIAIDDFHRASEDVEVSRFLASVIARTKSHVQWLVATRSTLDLPIATWLAYGDAHFVIGDRDLAFSEDEMRRLSSENGGDSITEPALRGIMEATSGWPVALTLALRSSALVQGETNLSLSTREVLFQYLAEQVYEELSAAEREVLHFAAYLPAIDVTVVEAAGHKECARILEGMRRRATFLSLEMPARINATICSANSCAGNSRSTIRRARGVFKRKPHPRSSRSATLWQRCDYIHGCMLQMRYYAYCATADSISWTTRTETWWNTLCAYCRPTFAHPTRLY